MMGDYYSKQRELVADLQAKIDLRKRSDDRERDLFKRYMKANVKLCKEEEPFQCVES